jgi:pimeloyl-ACP methyl ester carboxylesterase
MMPPGAAGPRLPEKTNASGVMAEEDSPQTALTLDSGERLAYQSLPGAGPGVLFLPGFNSDMGGTKAEALASWCAAQGRGFTRFDYRGHGRSGGRFADGTIGAWLADTLAILDRVTFGPQVLVGSSMGGWLALLVALARPARVAALVCIAPAPDFTERLWRERLDAGQRRSLEDQGFCEVLSEYDTEPYVITRRLLEEAREHFLLGAPIPIRVPVRLLQGQRDDAVPWSLTVELMASLESEDVELHLLKRGDHRLSEPSQLALMLATLEALVAQLGRGPDR